MSAPPPAAPRRQGPRAPSCSRACPPAPAAGQSRNPGSAPAEHAFGAGVFDPFTPHPGRERASLHIAPFYLLAGPGPHRVGDCGPRPGSPSEPGLPLPPTPIPRYKPMGPHAVAVSALLGLGLEELKARLEDAVLTATGRRVLTLRVRLAGAQLRCVGGAGEGLGRGGGGGAATRPIPFNRHV